MSTLICVCGKSYFRDKKFSINGEDFCSLECLRKAHPVKPRTEPKNPRYMPVYHSDCGNAY